MEDDALDLETSLSFLSTIEGTDAVVVGGQAISLWVAHYGVDEGDTPFIIPTTKDIDFLDNQEAAERLAAMLDGGKIVQPDQDYIGPTSRIVHGGYRGRILQIDFLHSIAGLNTLDAIEGAATLEVEDREGRWLRFNVLNPVDLLQSRLANINTLKRTDERSVNQARTALLVCERFLDDSLSLLRHPRPVQDYLRRLEFIIRDHAIHAPAYRIHSVDPLEVMKRFRDDERLDERWRSLRLEKTIARIERKRQRLRPAPVPEYPETTHDAKRSRDGRGVVIRKKEPPHRVDNPLGPACVTPTEVRYYLDGRRLSEEEWEARKPSRGTVPVR